MNGSIAHPQGIGGIIAESFRLFWRSLLQLLPFSLLISILVVIIEFIVTPVVIPGQPIVSTQIPTPRAVAALIIELIAFGLFISMLYQCNQVMISSACRFWQAIRMGARKFFSCFAFVVLYALIVFLGGIAFILPGIFLSILLGFGGVAIIVDDKGIFAALKHSAVLVWGNWWRTFFVILLFGLIIFIAAFILGLIVSIPMVFIFHVTVAKGIMINRFVSMIMMIFMLPLWVSVMIRLYHDLKARK